MKVITAIEEYNKDLNEISCFLAGGITNCPNWQQDVIEILSKKEDTDDLVIYNPRRENFPINDPNASEEQILWEFEHLETMNIFSMYFSGGESDQPICMYELGRNLVHMQFRYPKDYEDRLVITVEEGYRRKNDVLIQTNLATDDFVEVDVIDNYEDAVKEHAEKIYDAYLNLKETAFDEEDLINFYM